MKITFVRHGSLKPPYHDYNQLSLNDLTKLALQKVEPDVDAEELKKRVQLNELKKSKFEVIFTSPSKRARQTAKIMAKLLSITDIKEAAELREIIFNPKKLVDKNEYKKRGLQSVREGLFSAIEEGTNIEKTPEILHRVLMFKKRMKKSHYSSVLVITHGFFLRIVDLHLHNPRHILNAKSLNAATNYDYVRGFSISLS